MKDNGDKARKKVVFLGDSITEGCCACCPENIFHALAARALCFDAVNMGKSGTRIARQTTPSEDTEKDMDFVRRADDIGDADFVVVFGGTNDFGHGDAPLGRFGDETEYTFCGACRVLLRKLCEKYGKDKVSVILPLHRADENDPHGDGSKKSVAPILSDYVAALCREANACGVPILDLRGCDELDPNTERGAKNFQDGLHPNDAGHAILAQAVTIFMQKQLGANIRCAG